MVSSVPLDAALRSGERERNALLRPYKRGAPRFREAPLWRRDSLYVDMCAEEILALRGESGVTRGRREEALEDRDGPEEEAGDGILHEPEPDRANHRGERKP